MKNAKGDRKRQFASLGLAILAFAVMTSVAFELYRGLRDRDRLESRNDAERTMTGLIASLRDHDDFGQAIESIPMLRNKVMGVGIYSGTGESVYTWGKVPNAFKESLAPDSQADAFVRKYIENSRNDSLILLFRPFRVAPLPPPPKPGESMPPQSTQPPEHDEKHIERHSFFFSTLRKGEIVYLEIREPEYWARLRLENVIFPISILVLSALVLFIRELLLRNDEYRRRIDEQKNLVMLGTAASTLAHEIKNPLSSIRLQTRILQKTCPPSAMREIDIINDEVERLAALSHRVGDYLRDPAGNARLIDPSEVALEVGMRLCGRNLLHSEEAAPTIFMDPERLRSVLENLLRNALESEGPEEGVAIVVGKLDGKAKIEVVDRGKGISEEDKARAFDPFFTTKSRGTGIGLSVCQRFIQAAGGSISLNSRPGGGCLVQILLPSGEAR